MKIYIQMKKYLLILLTAVFALSLTGCKAFTETKATVNVKVVDYSSRPRGGESVYMFAPVYWNAADGRTIKNAQRTVITDNDGIAVFDLTAVELDWIGDQTNLYFATFDGNGKNVNGSAAVTVKKGDVKDITIKQSW